MSPGWMGAPVSASGVPTTADPRRTEKSTMSLPAEPRERTADLESRHTVLPDRQRVESSLPSGPRRSRPNCCGVAYTAIGAPGAGTVRTIAGANPFRMAEFVFGRPNAGSRKPASSEK